MANSVQEEYIHPVIAAMQNAYQLMDQAKRTKFNQDLDTRKADLEDAQFDEAKKQHGIETDFRQKNLDIALRQLELSSKTHELEQAKALQEYAASGGKSQKQDLVIQPSAQTLTGPNGEQSQMPAQPAMTFAGQGQSVLPGTSIPFDPSNYQSPQDKIDQQLNALRQTLGVQHEVNDPFEIAKENREKEARLSEIGLQGQNSVKTAATNHANQLELENMRGHFQLAAAQIAHQHNQEDMAPTYVGALNSVMDGQTSYSALPKDIKEGVSKLAATKGWALPTNQKDYSSKLDAATGVQGLLDQYKDLASKYSRDSPDTGLLGKASAFATGGGALPGTDLRSKIDSLKANGGALASFFDKQNRKSDAEILRQVVGLYDPRATMAQNLEKIQQHEGPLNNAVKGIFAGFKPDQLNYVLGNRGLKSIGGYDTSSAPTNLRQKYGY